MTSPRRVDNNNPMRHKVLKYLKEHPKELKYIVGDYLSKHPKTIKSIMRKHSKKGEK